MSELATALELKRAQGIVQHAKLCLDYANGQGAFAYRKRTGLLSLLIGPPIQSRLYHSAIYSPDSAPTTAQIEWAEKVLAEAEATSR